MRTLNDEQMKELYDEAVAKKVDSDFIQLIIMELQRRGLMHVPESKMTEHQYTA